MGADAPVVGEAGYALGVVEDAERDVGVPHVDGEEQLVTFMAEEVIGVDPGNGKLKWRYPHQNQWGQNINMPLMADANHMLISSPQAGAKGLKFTHDGDEVKVEEIWSTRKIQFYHVNTVRDGDWVYGSTGTMAPLPVGSRSG